MTSVRVLLPGALAEVAGGRRHLEVPVGPAAVVGDVLDALGAEHPALGRRLRDETGALRRFVNVFVDGRDVRDLAGVQTAVADGAEVQVLPSVAGG